MKATIIRKTMKGIFGERELIPLDPQSVNY
jgi:hypothetical protein